MVESYINISSDDEESEKGENFDWVSEFFKDDETDLKNVDEKGLATNLQDLVSNLERDIVTHLEKKDLVTNLEERVLVTNLEKRDLVTNLEERDLVTNLEKGDLVTEKRDLVTNLEKRDLVTNLGKDLVTNLKGRGFGTNDLGTNVDLVTNLDEDDDDCVMLECDPEKVKGDLEKDGEKGDDDDLMVVGEKGQIACRDYPHARHLCAKFLFASTPHEQHCPQCHCYVCDSVAPCIYWGTGSANNDHCHSTDQDPYWKAEREYSKHGNKAPIQVPALPLTQIQLASMTAIRACSTTPTNSVNPILVHQGRPSHLLSRNKHNPRLVSQQLLRSCNTSNQNAGRLSANILGAQLMNRLRTFKKPGSNGLSFSAIRSGGPGPINNSYVSQCPWNTAQIKALHNQILAAQQRVLTGTHSYNNGSCMGSVPPYQAKVPSQLNSGYSFVRPVSSQPVGLNNHFKSGNGLANSVSSGQSSFQTNMSSTFLTPVPPQVNSQPKMNCFRNQVPREVFHQPNSSACFALPSSELHSQPSMSAKTYENPLCSEFQVSTQENMGIGSMNPVYPQSQTSNQPNFLQQGNVTATNNNAANYLPSYMGSTDQCSQIDEIPAQDPVQDSVIPEKTNSPSFFCESDSWLIGFGNDGV